MLSSITYSDGRCVNETEDGYIIFAKRLTRRQIAKISHGTFMIGSSKSSKKYAAVLIPKDMLKNIFDMINEQNKIREMILMTNRVKKQKKAPLEPKKR